MGREGKGELEGKNEKLREEWGGMGDACLVPCMYEKHIARLPSSWELRHRTFTWYGMVIQDPPSFPTS